MNESGRVMFSTAVQKIWTSFIFTFPRNLGEWYHLSRKSGAVVFSHSQKNWIVGIYTSPENLD
jgi:hypothetical protein